LKNVSKLPEPAAVWRLGAAAFPLSAAGRWVSADGTWRLHNCSTWQSGTHSWSLHGARGSSVSVQSTIRYAEPLARSDGLPNSAWFDCRSPSSSGFQCPYWSSSCWNYFIRSSTWLQQSTYATKPPIHAGFEFGTITYPYANKSAQSHGKISGR